MPRCKGFLKFNDPVQYANAKQCLYDELLEDEKFNDKKMIIELGVKSPISRSGICDIDIIAEIINGATGYLFLAYDDKAISLSIHNGQMRVLKSCPLSSWAKSNLKDFSLLSEKEYLEENDSGESDHEMVNEYEEYRGDILDECAKKFVIQEFKGYSTYFQD